jgi:hypothetical protein
MAPLFSFSSCVCWFFYSLRKGALKLPRQGFGTSFFSFLGTTRGGVVLRFGRLLRCLHKTNLACDLAGIDSSFKLNLRAGC